MSKGPYIFIHWHYGKLREKKTPKQNKWFYPTSRLSTEWFSDSQKRFAYYPFCIIRKKMSFISYYPLHPFKPFLLLLKSCWPNVSAMMLHVIYTLSHILWAKWMGLILRPDPHCLMWKVMTCGCFKHTDHSASNGTRRLWNRIRTSSFTGDRLELSSPLLLMDAHCALALPHITFIWIIHHGYCSIITTL